MNLKNPKQITKDYIVACSNKVELPIYKMIILSIFAGAFVAFGAASSSAAVHGIENAGLAKLIAGTIFPVGLMLIVLVGGELFTGNCMMVMGVMKRNYTIKNMSKKLILVFFANFIGAVFIAAMVFYGGQFDLGNGALGAYTIKVALAKSTLPFGKAVVSGILCNILVCLAVLMAASATDVVGKICAIFFPIMAFVIGGFEHCVANMYYIPAGILAATNESYRAAATEIYGYTATQFASLNITNFLASNLLPVTIGNIVGGMFLIGIPMFLLHDTMEKKNDRIVKLEEVA